MSDQCNIELNLLGFWIWGQYSSHLVYIWEFSIVLRTWSLKNHQVNKPALTLSQCISTRQVQIYSPLLLPVLRTLKTSLSDTPLTFGTGTSHLPAFSFLFCLIMLDRTLALLCPSLSNRYAGTAPSGTSSSSFFFVFLSSCILMLRYR